MPICGPCSQQDHTSCVDSERMRSYELWAEKERANEKPEIPKGARRKEREEALQQYMQLNQRIERLRPQRGCPCHHQAPPPPPRMIRTNPDGLPLL